MADISKININGTEYNIKDAEARNQGPSLPTGGTIGQVLVKNSDADGDAGWYSPGHYPTDKWYLVDGIVEENVVAAYQFVNRESSTNACENINDGTYYPLINNNCTWSTSKGFYFDNQYDYLQNAQLVTNQNNVYSAAYGFSGVYNGTAQAPGIIFSSTKNMLLKAVNASRGPIMGGYYNPTIYPNGVLSGNLNTRELYYNGLQISLSNYESVYGGGLALLGYMASDQTPMSAYFTCFVLYNVNLSLNQHLQLSQNIRNLGGID